MKRTQLKQIISSAARDCQPRDHDRLVAAADEIDRVAIGTFVITDPEFACGCPAEVAGYYDREAESFVKDLSNSVKNEITDFIVRFDDDPIWVEEATDLNTYQQYVDIED